MFVDFIREFLTILINAEVADVFAVPMALFLSFMLLFCLFTMFANGGVKKTLLILICVIVGAFCIFSMADFYGFVTLPITLGG